MDRNVSMNKKTSPIRPSTIDPRLIKRHAPRVLLLSPHLHQQWILRGLLGHVLAQLDQELVGEAVLHEQRVLE